MAEANGVSDTAALKQQGYNVALDNAKGSIEALQITVGEKLLPVLTSLLNNYVAPGVNMLTLLADAVSRATRMPLTVSSGPLQEWRPPYQAVGGFVGDLVERAQHATMGSCCGKKARSACARRWMCSCGPGRHGPGDRGHYEVVVQTVSSWIGTNLPTALQWRATSGPAPLQPALTTVSRRVQYAGHPDHYQPGRDRAAGAGQRAYKSLVDFSPTCSSRPGSCWNAFTTLLLLVLSDIGGLAARQCAAGGADAGRLPHQNPVPGAQQGLRLCERKPDPAAQGARRCAVSDRRQGR